MASTPRAGESPKASQRVDAGLPEGDGTRFVWTTDVLPDELAESIGGLVEEGTKLIRHTLEATINSLPPSKTQCEG